MHDVEKFNVGSLIDLLRKVSISLERPVSTYLIGGLAMGTYGLKESTKDVDLVFKDDCDSEVFIRAIMKLGYDRKLKLDNVYTKLGAQGIFTRGGKQNFDIFINQVCKGLYLTKGMIQRSTRFDIVGKLKVNIISPEDIFLFKGITPRPGDLNDMYMLLQRGLNWKIMIEEIRSQPDHFRWIGDLYNKTGELEKNYDVKIPIREKIKDESELSIIICSILQILHSRNIHINEIRGITDREDLPMLERALNLLIKMDSIEIEKDMISLK